MMRLFTLYMMAFLLMIGSAFAEWRTFPGEVTGVDSKVSGTDWNQASILNRAWVDVSFSAGAITVVGDGKYRITGCAAGTLNTINGTAAGDVLIIAYDGVGGNCTIADNAGNIQLANDTSIVLSSVEDYVILIHIGSSLVNSARLSAGEWTDLGATIHPAETADDVVMGGSSDVAGTTFVDADDGSGLSVVKTDKLEVRANASDGGLLTLCEDTDIGTDCFSLNVGQTNLPSGTTTCTVDSNGKIPASCISGTKSIELGAAAWRADGTQCANASTVTIGSWGPQDTIVCTDNDAATMTATIVAMPDCWDAGQLTLEWSVIQDAADTNAFNADVVGRCTGDGESPVVYEPDPPISLDIATLTGSDAVDYVTSSAFTVGGICAAGDKIQLEVSIDATGTTTAMATLHNLGGKLEYTCTGGD